MEQFKRSVEMLLKKDTEEKGIIEGQLITHSVIDSYGDYFEKETLDKIDKEKTYFLLHMHEWSKELGTLKVYQDEKGNLKFTAKLDLSADENGNALNLDAQKVYSMMKQGANYEMSVGGFLKQREWGKIQTDKGEIDARIIKEIEVVEGSVVLKGAVPGATVETVKNENINKNKEDNMSEKNKDFENLEKGIETVNENIKKTDENVENLKKSVEGFEEKSNKTNEELEKMAQTLDELMKKGIQSQDDRDNEAVEKFRKYLVTGDSTIEGLSVQKAAINTGNVAVLIPNKLHDEILKETKENSHFLMNGKIFTISGEFLKVPVKNTITEANEIVLEGAGNTKDGGLGFTEIELRAGYRQVRYPVTDEAREDSAFDLVGEIKEAIAEDFGQTLSALTVKGVYNTTTGQFIEGFLTNADVIASPVVTATTNVVVWEDMVKLETNLKTSYRQRAAYYVSPKLYEEMKLWKDGNGIPLWNTIKDGATMKFNGYPVYVEEFLDEVKKDKFPAVFCDFKQGYAYAMKKDFEQELHRDPDKRITSYYTRIRLGGKVMRPKAFSVLKVK